MFLSRRSNASIRFFEAEESEDEVPSKSEARSSSSTSASCSLIAVSQRFSSERIVAAVAQLLPDRSNVGWDVRCELFFCAGRCWMNGPLSSTARTGFSRNTSRRGEETLLSLAALSLFPADFAADAAGV